jgi:hypothetical protein
LAGVGDLRRLLDGLLPLGRAEHRLPPRVRGQLLNTLLALIHRQSKNLLQPGLRLRVIVEQGGEVWRLSMQRCHAAFIRAATTIDISD